MQPQFYFLDSQFMDLISGVKYVCQLPHFDLPSTIKFRPFNYRDTVCKTRVFRYLSSFRSMAPQQETKTMDIMM